MSEHREKAIQDSLLLYGGDPHGEQFEDWLDQRELVEELAEALMKLRGAVDGLAPDYAYLTECKAIAIEALNKVQQ